MHICPWWHTGAHSITWNGCILLQGMIVPSFISLPHQRMIGASPDFWRCYKQQCSEQILVLSLLDTIWLFPVNTFLEMQMEKAMAPHSSTLAWKVPWKEEPGRLQSMGLWRVIHDCVTSLPLFTFTHWRRKWQPTPVFLPGESQGRGSLVGCSLWGCTELDTTEAT